MTHLRSLVLIAAMAALPLPGPAAAAPPVTHEVEGDFADIASAVEQAIINAGLVIDGHNIVGDMLARTKEDVGGAKDLFTHADIYTFCSAVVSRKVMEADLLNLQFCPYSIFLYEAADKPGTIVVGHRDYAADGVPEVQELAEKIVADALMLN